MSQPRSRSSCNQQRRPRQPTIESSSRNYEIRCESFPFDEYSAGGGGSRDDSSVVLRSGSHSPTNAEDRPVRGFLDAVACLCIGNGAAKNYVDESEHFVGTPDIRRKEHTCTIVSPRDVTKLEHPVAYIADQETGTLKKRSLQTHRSSSFPASRFIFRPVSDEESTITGFASMMSRGWEV